MNTSTSQINTPAPQINDHATNIIDLTMDFKNDRSSSDVIDLTIELINDESDDSSPETDRSFTNSLFGQTKKIRKRQLNSDHDHTNHKRRKRFFLEKITKEHSAELNRLHQIISDMKITVTESNDVIAKLTDANVGLEYVNSCLNDDNDDLKYDNTCLKHANDTITVINSNLENTNANLVNINTNLKNINKNIQSPTCIICCVNNFNCVLPCGHVFCRRCVTKITRRTRRVGPTMTCPTCRKVQLASSVTRLYV